MTAIQLWLRSRAEGKSRFAPAVITDAALYAAGFDDAGPPARVAATTAAHLSFGMAAGIGYVLLVERQAKRLTGGPGGLALVGAGFGVGVWASSYPTWVQHLGLLPPPQRDDRQRQARLIVGHVGFGATTAIVADTMTRGRIGLQAQ
jgi:hypothetical protein